jgi:hypothetical protein
MTKATGVGRGGRRPGAGRPRKWLILPVSQVLSGTPVNGPDADVLQALRRLADRDSELKHRLDRLERAGAEQGRQLAQAREALERLLRHQAAIARSVGALEAPSTPKINRRRPLE